MSLPAPGPAERIRIPREILGARRGGIRHCHRVRAHHAGAAAVRAELRRGGDRVVGRRERVRVLPVGLRAGVRPAYRCAWRATGLPHRPARRRGVDRRHRLRRQLLAAARLPGTGRHRLHDVHRVGSRAPCPARPGVDPRPGRLGLRVGVPAGRHRRPRRRRGPRRTRAAGAVPRVCRCARARGGGGRRLHQWGGTAACAGRAHPADAHAPRGLGRLGIPRRNGLGVRQRLGQLRGAQRDPAAVRRRGHRQGAMGRRDGAGRLRRRERDRADLCRPDVRPGRPASVHPRGAAGQRIGDCRYWFRERVARRSSWCRWSRASGRGP